MDIVIVLAISVIAFIHVHELGHFFAARLCGIKVLRLHIGVGPKLYSRADRHGTEIRWGLIPAAFTEVTNQDLAAVPPPYQLVFAAAGPVANFVCALVLLAVAYSTSLPPSQMATIGIVDANGPAFAAGIREGDRITALDGRLISNWTDVGLHLVGRVGDSGTVGFDVIRQDARQRFELPINDWQVDAASIDLFEDFGFRPAAPVQADTGSSSLVAGLTSAVVDTGRMFWSTAMAGFKMIFGEMRITNFVGGLQLTQFGLDAANLGLADYLKLAALFSMGFCIINSLPGPVVDGLSMFKATCEWFSGRPLSPAAAKAALVIGSVLAFGPLVICLLYELNRAMG